MMEKPFSNACENNKKPILEVLKQYLIQHQNVLEIGTGTGQHAVYFAKELQNIHWQCSDRSENHAGIQLWLQENPAPNLYSPIDLDVANFEKWPKQNFDAVFSSNTCHIMSWDEVQRMFNGVGNLLSNNGLLIIYGPFNKDGQFTSESNQRFQQWLKQQGSHMGIRDMGELDKLAAKNDMKRIAEIPMPANNFILIWQKQTC